MAQTNDIVLIYLEDAPVCFARIESILPDAKKNWYHIKLLMLQIPVQTITWILKDEYINGSPFNMNGKKMRLEKIEPPAEVESVPDQDDESSGADSPDNSNDAKIISFADLKKNHGHNRE